MTRLFQALPCQEQRRSQVLRHQGITLQMAANSTFRAVSTRAGTSIQTAGELAVQYSSTL